MWVPRRLRAGGTRYLSEGGSASGAENSELFGSVNKEQFGPGVSWCPLPQFLQPLTLLTAKPGHSFLGGTEGSLNPLGPQAQLGAKWVSRRI